MAGTEDSKVSVTLHIRGAPSLINHAFGTTLANQLRFTFPMSQVQIKHSQCAGDFVKCDAMNFEALRYDELDIKVIVGEDPPLENSFVMPCKNTQDAFELLKNPADTFFKAIRQEAENKAFTVEQNSDNWQKYVPDHLKSVMIAYGKIQQLLNSPLLFGNKGSAGGQ